MANTEKITVGLIRGRHNLPVDKYMNYKYQSCTLGRVKI